MSGANAIVELMGSQVGLTGLTLSLALPGPLNTISFAITGLAFTEDTTRAGIYQTICTAGLVGDYQAFIYDASGNELANGWVPMTNDTTVHEITSLNTSLLASASVQQTILSAIMGMVAGGQKLTFQALVQCGGLMTVIPGDSYYTVDGRDATWTSGGAWPDLTGASGFLIVYGPPPASLQMLLEPLVFDVDSGSGQAVSAQLAAADTAQFNPGDTLNYAIHIVLSNGHPFTPIVGTNRFIVGAGVGIPA